MGKGCSQVRVGSVLLTSREYSNSQVHNILPYGLHQTTISKTQYKWCHLPKHTPTKLLISLNHLIFVNPPPPISMQEEEERP